MTYITDSPRTDGAPSKDWVEGLRPSSPTLDLARRSLGLMEESLRAVRLSDFRAPGVPSEIVRMRFDHAEGKRLNLVSELRARYVQLKEEAARQAEAEEQLTLSQASQAAYMASPRRSSVAEYEIKRHERLARRREQEESRKAAHERAMEESARKGVEALERERVKKAEELKRRALAAKKDRARGRSTPPSSSTASGGTGPPSTRRRRRRRAPPPASRRRRRRGRRRPGRCCGRIRRRATRSGRTPPGRAPPPARPLRRGSPRDRQCRGSARDDVY